MDKDMNNFNLRKCIERMEKFYESDTFIFLDCVLTDDPVEPEYSANTVFYRLEDIVAFQNLYYKAELLNVTDLLLNSGYSNEDVELLMQKRIKENQRHS